ncbi:MULTISPECIES: DUF2264 domain-containing protein [unclassified Enterococcus]|uniref:DUF2264 domain-containing protein n=1 Tax=unclassified Enterococcus TaxID=2608891 RepID=UPI000A355B07|nr:MULTISPECIES: DUF2264 domain-containing protein [unclassified Enterococcus]OTO77326.1 hypothetical protein A5865_001202 [Enterococcus sp. 12E11_DIV0728]OUZ16505.1 hypothetical protein A5868_001426 [Enterococcus sp. 12F9_DIV0723]
MERIFSKASGLENKAELTDWFSEMLPKDQAYLDQTGSSYTADIRELESLLRPLWGLIALHKDSLGQLSDAPCFARLLRLIAERKLPSITTKNRQIAVELGVIGYAIGTFGESFLELFPRKDRTYFIDWLNQLNEITFPAGNWYFFLVLVNSGLKKAGLPYSQGRLDFALTGIEAFYLGDGWYSDGENQQRDYYVSFAFHYYGLLYYRMNPEDKYGKNYRQRAIIFAEAFFYWFDDKGRSLPFGRSLTYRFAHISFWSALVVTGVWQDTKLTLPAIKFVILNHLRFWKQQPITLPNENNLSIGYAYNNLLLSEDYNAPASPMWAFKAFVLLELPASDTFWQVSETRADCKKSIVTQKHAGFQLQSSGYQTVALSSRQFSSNSQLYHHREKYSKFAYSTLFGFNLTRDNQGLEQFAIDSTLAFSIPGTDQWQSRGRILDHRIYQTYGVSRWQVLDRVAIISYLVPLKIGGHLRIHEIQAKEELLTAEGGFPIHHWNPKYQTPKITEDTCLLTTDQAYSLIEDLGSNRIADVVCQGPNSNIYSAEKNAIPVLKTMIPKGRSVFGAYVNGDDSLVPTVNKNYEFSEREDYFVVRQKEYLEEFKIKKERF